MKVTEGVWIVTRNDDLTEGRGSSVEVGRFTSEEVALAVARRIDVQGSDGRVYEYNPPDVPVYDSAEEWLEGTGDPYARQVHKELLVQDAQEKLKWLEELGSNERF